MRNREHARERSVEIEPVVPAWLTWMAAAVIGALAIGALARMLEAVFDLDPS